MIQFQYHCSSIEGTTPVIQSSLSLMELYNFLNITSSNNRVNSGSREFGSLYIFPLAASPLSSPDTVIQSTPFITPSSSNNVTLFQRLTKLSILLRLPQSISSKIKISLFQDNSNELAKLSSIIVPTLVSTGIKSYEPYTLELDLLKPTNFISSTDRILLKQGSQFSCKVQLDRNNNGNTNSNRASSPASESDNWLSLFVRPNSNSSNQHDIAIGFTSVDYIVQPSDPILSENDNRYPLAILIPAIVVPVVIVLGIIIGLIVLYRKRSASRTQQKEKTLAGVPEPISVEPAVGNQNIPQIELADLQEQLEVGPGPSFHIEYSSSKNNDDPDVTFHDQEGAQADQ